MVEAKSITGLPQIDNKTVPHIWSEYELYERYLYTLGEQSKVDYNENQQSIEIKVALTFIEWTEEKKRKIEEEKRKIEEEKKRNETLRKIKSLPPEKCSYCGGTGIKSYGTLTYKCSACDGKGIRNADGSIINDGTRPCPDCYGTGRIGQNTCYKCKGLGHIWVN